MTETKPDKEADKIIKQLTEKINKKPRNAENFYKRAEEYKKKEDFDKCYKDARHAIGLDPKLLSAAILGGEAATKLGKFQEAHNLFSLGLKIDPKDGNLIKGLKRLQRAIVDSYDAEDTTDQGYNALDFCTQSPYPGDDEMLNLEKEILDKRHEIKEIPRTKSPDLTTDQRKRAAQAAMAGHKCMMAGKFSEALESFNHAVEIETDNVILRRLRAEVHFINQDPISAMKDLMHIQKGDRTADAWKLGGILKICYLMGCLVFIPICKKTSQIASMYHILL